MPHTTTVVVGAGHCGLAVSRCLAARSIDHVVIERGEVAESARFSGALPHVCALADLKLGRLLDTLDAWADRAGIDAEAPQRFAPTELPASPDLSARVGDGGIETIVWATGFRPDLSFVEARVLDRKGRPVHDGGVTTRPRPLPDRPAVPESPQVDVDRRGGVGRPRAGRAPRHLSGHARPRRAS